MNRLIGVFSLIACFAIGNALECYVCKDQAGNVDKCLNTIKTCNQDEDVCSTEVRWGSAPYWTSGGLKQFYVSKTCKSKRDCERTKKTTMKYCTHLWWQDWKCSDCCVGDRCNYYIFSGSGIPKTSFTLIFAIVFTPLIASWTVQ